MAQLVLIRHGQSEWNKQNRFTGWEDVVLTDKGVEEAKNAGAQLLSKGVKFDVAFCSVLKRSIHTLWEVLKALDQSYLPVEKHWRLNERHYGALQGLNKKETVEKYTEKQVHLWRRGYKVQPPQTEKIKCENLLKYPDLREYPTGESLEMTLTRVKPYLESHILKAIHANKNTLVVAHGNSIRAILKLMKNISDEEIVKLEIATGDPILVDVP